MPVNQKLELLNGPFVILIIMDGLGLGINYQGNSVNLADTPTLNFLWEYSRTCTLNASADAVGLPDGIPGNSEVGHLNLGSGQVLEQTISKLNSLIKTKKFSNLSILKKHLQDSKNNGKKYHILGLLSASGVHSDIRHLFALLEVCKKQNVDPFIHVITDGRDTEAKESFRYLNALKDKLSELKIGKIASIHGRFWSMDRNNSWDRTQKAYNAMIGRSDLKFSDPMTVIQNAYKLGQNDETLEPVTMINDIGNPIGVIEPDDFVFFYNFREDRARQITKAFVMPINQFPYFKDRPVITKNFMSMTGYGAGIPAEVLLKIDDVAITVADVISQNGMTQLHMAETEKYAHVTYFFNGGREKKHVGEEFIIIPSPHVVDYATVPEMSAYRLRDEAVSYIQRRLYNFIVINFANPDMVGHSGQILSTKKAIEVTDTCVRDVVKAGLSIGATIFLTADHGNAEQEVDLVSGLPDRKHTINPTPFMVIDQKILKYSLGAPRPLLLKESPEPIGVLSDVGTSVLYQLGLEVDQLMMGTNLVKAIT